MTTASAPSGIGAPVKIRTASPGELRSPRSMPAACSPTACNRAPFPEEVHARSQATDDRLGSASHRVVHREHPVAVYLDVVERGDYCTDQLHTLLGGEE